MSDTPTPRTGAEVWPVDVNNYEALLGTEQVPADFARTLERELTVAQQRIAELEAENKRLRTCSECDRVGGPKCFGLVCNECWSELEQDKARLVSALRLWMAEHSRCMHEAAEIGFSEFQVKASMIVESCQAIDNAMKGQQP